MGATGRGTADNHRVPTGIAGLDEMLGGGLLFNSVAVVKGAPGTGKSCIGMEFISRGAKEYGEPGLIITFEEFPRQLYRDALSIGFDLRELEHEGMLRTIFTTPAVFLREIQQPGGIFDRTIEEVSARRVFVDSMTQLERITQDPVQLREIMYTFLNGLLRYEITAVVTQEDAFITGNMSVAEAGLSYIVDTIIQLRYVEISSSIDRALFVLKHRASDHDKRIRRMSITPEGVKVEAARCSSIDRALFVLKHRASDHDKRIRRMSITPEGVKVEAAFEGREGILSGNPYVTRRLKKAEEFFK